ncbi:hypothetical protein TRVA0_002S02894 [Trichomonascus vanleenenianus]|uniref:uncharacterized protein n=1 Tax=Trichomonascus vanleenenianus TaxID=2268995 RepID=UPI003ECB1FD0
MDRGRSRSPRSRSRSPRSYSRSRSRSVTPERVVRESSAILVLNLSPRVRRGHIDEIFSEYGYIVGIQPRKSREKSFLVTYETSREAGVAVNHMDGGIIDGSIVKVVKFVSPVMKRKFRRERDYYASD